MGKVFKDIDELKMAFQSNAEKAIDTVNRIILHQELARYSMEVNVVEWPVRHMVLYKTSP